MLIVLTLFSVAAWLVFTHRISRFLVPGLLPLVVLGGAGAAAFENKRLRIPLSIILVALLGLEGWATLSLRAPSTELELLFGRYTTRNVFAESARQLHTYDHEAIMSVKSLRHGSRVLFYGEAETLYCLADIIAPTVFDENPLDGIVRAARSPDDILNALKRLGVTHIYVNLGELHRLQWSYAFTHAGRERHGCSTLFENEQQKANLHEFLARHCRVVFPRPLEERYWGHMRDEFIRVLDSHDRDPQVSLSPELCVNVPETLLPELPPELSYLRKQLPDQLVPIVWHKLQFCVYEIKNGRAPRLRSSQPDNIEHTPHSP